MTLQQLEYIVALDTHRHFVKAAEHCFVTQPTLTMQVQKLEEHLGVILFDRAGKPLRPTAIGELVVMKARQILREARQLKELVSTAHTSLKGDFRIGIIPTLAPYLLPLFLPAFVRKFPESNLHIRELRSEEIIEGLHQDSLDIGILVSPLEDRELREISLFEERFFLYLSPEHPLTGKDEIQPEDIDPEKLLLLEEGHCFRNQALQLCQSGGRKRGAGFEYQSGSIETLKNLVDGGMGYTLIPELAVLDGREQARVKKFVRPEPVREVSLVVHNSFSREAVLERLRGCILENLPASLPKGQNYIRVKWR